MSPINNTEQLTVQYTLQHSFTNLRISYGRNQGRKMLEHSSRKTTEIYTHFSTNSIQNIATPIDTI
jgi:site-specific recombinase XerD